MNKKESWSQLLTLLLQTIVPLVIAGGATGILSVFKVYLPQLLYTIFLYVIWGAIIVMLIWLVLRLIFGDSPKKFVKWIKDRRQNRARQKLAMEWHSKWLELGKLVARLIETHVEQMTEEEENEYRELHFWFVNNRSKLLPVWQSFEGRRTETAHEHNYNSTTDLGYKIFRENYRDPFSFLYSPLLST